MSKYCYCNSQRWYKELKRNELTPVYELYLRLLDDYEKEPYLFTDKTFRAIAPLEAYLFAICYAIKWTNKEPLGFPIERLERFFNNKINK